MEKKLVEELNKQMNAEFYSSYLYFSMATNFESKNLTGFANWMHVQAHEEWTHGMKIRKYLLDRNASIKLSSIEVPPQSWDSPLQAFKDALKHEEKVTSMINSLFDLSRSSKDNAAEIFLQWFVNEQVEEEANARSIIEKLETIGESANGIFMMDHELGKRKRD